MKNRKFKISIIDVLIVLVFALVIVLGVKIINKTQVSSMDIPDIEFTAEIKMQDESFFEAISIGDDIYDSVKGGYLGKVTKVDKKPASDIAEDKQNGKFVKSYYEGKYDVYVTICGTPGTFNNKTIMFASKEIRIGDEVFIRNKNYAGHGYVTGLDILDEKAGAEK